MNKKKLILSIGVSLLLIAVMVIGIYFVSKPFTSEYDGVITVEVVNLENDIIKSKEIEFNKGDKLRDLVSSNFENFVVEESEYGAYILRIEDIVNDDDLFIYIAIYVNDEYANSGLDTLEFSDGDKISFKAESWQTTN